MVSNKIRPHHCDAHHRHEPRYAFHVAQMGVLDVETGGLHRAEACLNLPSPLVSGDSVLGSVEADENLKFGNSVRVLQFASGKVNILTLQKKEFVIEPLLSEFESAEEPLRSDALSRSWLCDPEMLLDADIIADAHEIEPADPFLADEFTVSDKAIDAVFPEKTDKPLHQFLALLPIGIASFVKQAEYEREGYAFVRHAKHEDIDVEISELPIRAVHRQNKIFLAWQQRKNHPGHDVKAERIFGDETLEPAQVGITVKSSRHGGGQFMKADSLHHTQCVEKQRHELYACQIHMIAKMLLHNRKDCVNFERVLGISNLHGEKLSNFSIKLLNFRDFCKYNNLIINSLIIYSQLLSSTKNRITYL